MEMIENEADKIIKRNECTTKYENSMGRIQIMIEERLIKLESFR